MDTWIIYTFEQYSVPKVQKKEVEAYDVTNAISQAVVDVGSIICVKLKAPIAMEEE